MFNRYNEIPTILTLFDVIISNILRLALEQHRNKYDWG